MSKSEKPSSIASGPRWFVTTQWSTVLAAGDTEDSRSREALEALCQKYWRPLYCYARRRGHDPEGARDMTQGFFLHMIEKKSFRAAARERGKFRSFLLASFNNYLHNEWDKTTALKRGGGYGNISLDTEYAEGRYQELATDPQTPEEIFDRVWGLAQLDRVLDRLREEADQSGKSDRFDQLVGFLTGDCTETSYRGVGQRLRMTEGAVKVAVHRMRLRFGILLREEIEDTVDSSNEIEEEIAHLLAAVRA